MQYNFTDPESRIMKAGNGKHYTLAYNAQGAVDVEGSYLILGKRVTDVPNDKKELVPSVESVPEEIRTVTDVSGDTGYYSEEAITKVESGAGPTAYNFKRLFNMTGGLILFENGVLRAANS